MTEARLIRELTEKPIALVVHGCDGCNPNAIREDVLLPMVFDAVRGALSNPDGIANFRRAIENEVQQGQAANAAQIRQLRRQVEDLAQKIKTGRQNLLIVPPRMVDELTPILDDWQREREKLLAEVAQLEEAEAKAADDRARVDQAMEAFHQLGEWLSEPDREGLPMSMKTEALATLVDRIEVRFETWDRGPKRRQSRCVDFTVHFRDVPGLLNRLTVDVLPRTPSAGR